MPKTFVKYSKSPNMMASEKVCEIYKIQGKKKNKAEEKMTHRLKLRVYVCIM